MRIRTNAFRLCRSIYMYPLFHLLEDIRAVGSRHLTEPVCSSGVIIAICFRIGRTWRALVHAKPVIQTQHEQEHSAVAFCRSQNRTLPRPSYPGNTALHQSMRASAQQDLRCESTRQNLQDRNRRRTARCVNCVLVNQHLLQKQIVCLVVSLLWAIDSQVALEASRDYLD